MSYKILSSTLQRFRRRFISGLPWALENQTQKVPCMEKWNFVNEFVFLTDAFLATGIFKFQLFENACKFHSYAFLNVLLSGCCCILDSHKVEF